MTNVEERYSRSIQSSHLEVTIYPGDVDALIACGWVRDGLATTLYRMRVEFDACDMRSIRPFLPDPLPIGYGEEVWDEDLKDLRVTTIDERAEKIRQWQAAEKARVAKDYADRRKVAKALALVHMKSLPAARDAMGRFVMAQATRQHLDATPEDELRLSGRILDHILDPQCEVCSGVKFKLIQGTGRLSNMPCGGCDGTGARRLLCMGVNGARRDQVRCMCAVCNLGRSILADVDRKMERVNGLLHRFLKEFAAVMARPLPPGATMARPRLAPDGGAFYEFSADGKAWTRNPVAHAERNGENHRRIERGMMDKDLIERLAREAGMSWSVEYRDEGSFDEDVERFSALIAEECAKLCDSMDNGRWEHSPPPEVCAAAIRERFK